MYFSLHHSDSRERQHTYYNSVVVFGDQKNLPQSCRLLVLVAKQKTKDQNKTKRNTKYLSTTAQWYTESIIPHHWHLTLCSFGTIRVLYYCFQLVIYEHLYFERSTVNVENSEKKLWNQLFEITFKNEVTYHLKCFFFRFLMVL